MSTPWIVFDRDSRVGEGRSTIEDVARSALRIGAVFASNPSFRPEVVPGATVTETSADPDGTFRPDVYLAEAGMFPHSSPESVVEPSSMVVASDVVPDSSSAIPLTDSREVSMSAALLPPAVLPGRGRVGAIAGACGVLAMAGVILALAAGGTHSHEAAMPKSTAPTKAVAAVAVVAPPAAETVAAPAPPAPASEPTTEPVSTKAPADPKKRFGKLTIKADAKHKSVWFDGKRMLGSGQRSFLVFCGMHTVAVSDKADTKDIEVPCNGEYVVSK